MTKSKQVLRQESASLFDQFSSVPACLVVQVSSYVITTQGANALAFQLAGQSNVIVGVPVTTFAVGSYYTTFAVGSYYTTLCVGFAVGVTNILALFSESDEFLSPAEISDINESWKEIEEGKAKTFRSVDELLKELKS